MGIRRPDSTSGSGTISHVPTNYHFYSQTKSCSYAKVGNWVKKTLRFSPTNRVHLGDKVK